MGSSTAPKWIDLYTSGLFAIGIYEVNGDRLKLCLARSSSPEARRPKSFSAEPSSNEVVLVLERYQPSGDEKKLRFNLSVDEKTSLGEAYWYLHELIDNGQPIDLNRPLSRTRYLHFVEYGCDVFQFRLDVNNGNRELVPVGGGFGGGTQYWQYVIDPASQPKTITFRAGLPNSNKELLGIYKFNGDQLTIAYHESAPRPEKFESAAGSGITLMTLESRLSRRGGGGRGGRGGTPAAAEAPPTVRVTQPVVCNVCDYEEYAGRLEKGVVQFPIPDGCFSMSGEASATVKEGDLLAEKADPGVYAAQQSLIHVEYERQAASKTNDAKLLAAAEANVKSARESLDRAEREHPPEKIVAPFSGRCEQRWTDATYSQFSSLSIASPDSLLVSFDVPESVVLDHRRATNRKPGWELSLPVVFELGDEKGYPHHARVFSVAEGIDPKTHTQRWQAVVPNKDGLFMPGMSVRIRVITSEPHKVMLVPSKPYVVSWTGSTYSDEVLVVNDRNVTEARKVKVGREYDDLSVVAEGLSVKDWIVVMSGYSFQLSSGMAIKPERYTTPPPPWAAISVPPAVAVARPIAREVSDFADYTGRVDNMPVWTFVYAPVAGVVEQAYWKEGQVVKQGDLLAEILADADESKLISLREKLDKARLDERGRRRDREEPKEVKAAHEALEAARAQLPRTKVFAPCGGRINNSPRLGRIAVGSSLASITPPGFASAYFDVDERTVIRLRRSMAGQKPGWELALTVSCGLADDRGFPIRGKVSSVNSGMDPNTGTQKWALVLPNKDGVLVPGMFLRVRLATSAPYKALLVPERALGSDAVGRDQGQKFVLVVNGQSAVDRRDVETGQVQDDGLRAVTKGLSGDDRVVLDPSKVTAGMNVKPEEPAPAAPATQPPVR